MYLQRQIYCEGHKANAQGPPLSLDDAANIG